MAKRGELFMTRLCAEEEEEEGTWDVGKKGDTTVLLDRETGSKTQRMKEGGIFSPLWHIPYMDGSGSTV